MYQNSGQSSTTGELDLTVNADRNAEKVIVTLHVSPAPTTSEDFTVTVGDSVDSNFNTVLFRRDLSAGGVTEVIVDETLLLNDGKYINAYYPNTDGVQVACQITLGEV